MVVFRLSHILSGGNMARKRKHMTKSVLRLWAIDSNSYMEPEENDSLSRGDVFCFESIDGDMSDELVP